MASSQRYPLSQLIHVDEFMVDGKEEDKQDVVMILKRNNRLNFTPQMIWISVNE